MGEKNKTTRPSQWLQRFIRWFCDEDLAEAIEGDLEEAFSSVLQEKGKLRAQLFYIWNVLKFIQPRFVQKLSRTQDYAPRFGNYLKVAIRNFKKYPLISGINFLGLSLGMATVLLSALYLQHELAADPQVAGKDRVFRVVREYRSQVYANLPFEQWYQSSGEGQLKMVQALNTLPEVEKAAHFTTSGSAIMGREFFVEVNGKQFRERDLLFTNTPSAFFDLFNWTWRQGNLSAALSEQVILTEATAKKYFGSDWRQGLENASIRFNEKDYLISGVIETVPTNAHFSFDLLLGLEKIPFTWGAYTYIRLNENVDPEGLKAKINEAYYTVRPEAVHDPLEKGLSLQPIRDIHLGSDYLYELEANANPMYVYLFAAIGLLVLVITCTNYINLSVAVYTNRLKEIGVRKVLGARKRDVRNQFLFESVFITGMSLPIALFIASLVSSPFNELLAVNIDLLNFLKSSSVLWLLALVLGLGLLCGVYPAMVLTHRPLLTLLSKTSGGTLGSISLRKFLLGFQFLLLVLLTCFSFYVHSQLRYIQNKELGFEREGVMNFRFRNLDDFKALREELLSHPDVLEVGNGDLPGSERFNTTSYRFEDVETVFDDINQVYMDLGSARLLGLQSASLTALEEGKESVYLINETGAAKYEVVSGKPRAALLGQRLIEAPMEQQEDGTMGYPEVVDGFVDDFHYFSLKSQLTPMAVKVYRELPWVFGVNVKVNTTQLYEVVEFIEDSYYTFEQERPFDLVFLEDRLDRLYANEQKVAGLVTVMSVLAIVLAFSGLVGLTYYMARVKQREVAIRKVLGARTGGLLLLMSREFVLVGLIALLFALPVAMYLADAWLSSFAFRVSTNLLHVFVIALLAMGAMVLAIISQSYRTAQANPVDYLKQE